MVLNRFNAAIGTRFSSGALKVPSRSLLSHASTFKLPFSRTIRTRWGVASLSLARVSMMAGLLSSGSRNKSSRSRVCVPIRVMEILTLNKYFD